MSDHLQPADADGRKWTIERIKYESQRVSEAGLGQSINVVGYRQIAIAISRRQIRKGLESTIDEHYNEGDQLQDDLLGEIADEQVTHSLYVAGAVYVRDTQELVGTIASRRQQFRVISVDWYRFLGFQSTEQAKKEGLKRKRYPFEDKAEEARTERQVVLRRIDTVAELQWIIRKKVTIRSVQGEAIYTIQ